MATGRDPLNPDQHFTRLGQAISNKDIYRMAKAFVDHFVCSYEQPPSAIIIDLDHTSATTYGNQQMSLFHG